jgi:hypothetical protein
MSRSALNAEVEYRLRMQERERPRHTHAIPEIKEQRGFLSRVVVLLKRGRQGTSQVKWTSAGRPLTSEK